MAKFFLKQGTYIHDFCLNGICFLSVIKSTLYLFWQIAYKRFIEESAGISYPPNVDKLFTCSMLKNWQLTSSYIEKMSDVYKKKNYQFL